MRTLLVRQLHLHVTWNKWEDRSHMLWRGAQRQRASGLADTQRLQLLWKQHKDENLELQDETDIGQDTNCQLIQVKKVNYIVLRQDRVFKAPNANQRARRSHQRGHFPMWHLSPASKCLHWQEWKWSFWVYRVCNWPEIELSALIHPEWAAKSWPLCVFSSCFITVGRTVSTLILSWLESVSEIS